MTKRKLPREKQRKVRGGVRRLPVASTSGAAMYGVSTLKERAMVVITITSH